jgi:hypothetical protein
LRKWTGNNAPAPSPKFPVREAPLASVERGFLFPPPWSVEETDDCFIVRDANGQPLAYIYFEEEPGRRSAARLLTRDGARRIAKLPGLLKC